MSVKETNIIAIAFFSIDKQRKQILARREAVKEKAAERRGLLHLSQAYQQFQADADDMFTWMTEKRKMASDESYRDLSNLERKLQKHEAFERELRANEGRLRNLNKVSPIFCWSRCLALFHMQ